MGRFHCQFRFTSGFFVGVTHENGRLNSSRIGSEENSGAASIQEVKLWIKRRVVRDYWPEILHLRYSNPQIEADLETSKFWQKHNRRNILETLFTILLDLIGDP